jgi:hypothetical protein
VSFLFLSHNTARYSIMCFVEYPKPYHVSDTTLRDGNMCPFINFWGSSFSLYTSTLICIIYLLLLSLSLLLLFLIRYVTKSCEINNVNKSHHFTIKKEHTEKQRTDVRAQNTSICKINLFFTLSTDLIILRNLLKFFNNSRSQHSRKVGRVYKFLILATW